MLRPSMYDIINKGDNYYEFVVAVSQRAREITDLAEEQRIDLTEKSVELAIDEFYTGKVKVDDYIVHDNTSL